MQRSLVATALVRGPCAAPAEASAHGARSRLRGLSLAAATAALLALWCAFLIALGLLYSPLPAD